ncbi:MAG: putative baseplate assembly protein, partial [Blastocatellia bacterium]
LLDFMRSTTVEARFNWAGGRPPQEIERFFQQLVYQYRTQGAVRTIAPTLVAASGGNQVRVQFSIAEAIDAETMRGVGLSQDVASRWLRAVLTTPFPDDFVAQSLQLSSSRLRVSADDLPPDLAFNNTAPLDVTKDFFPFGETPKVGDAIYIGSREAFAKPGANVTLRTEIKPTPLPRFVWEYWDGDSWTALPQSNVEDQTNKFTKDGRVSLLVPAPVPQGGPTGGVAAWSNLSLRVRVADGRYRNAPVVTQFKLVNETTLKAAVSANGATIQVDYPKFAAQGQVLLVEDEHVVVSGVAGDNELKVTPAFRKAHAAGRPAQIRATVPVTKISQNVAGGAASLIVSATGSISPQDVLLIDDNTNPEFIIVTGVGPVLDAQGAVILGLLRISTAPLRFAHNKDVSLARVTGFNFFGLADDDWQDFAKPFDPFGKNPSQGDVFSFYLFGGFFFSLLSTTAATPGATVAAPTATAIGLSPTIGLTTGPIIGPPKGKIGVITNPFISGFIFIDPQLRFTSPQFRVNLDVKVVGALPAVDLRWEYLDANGWRRFDPVTDGTNRFREEGPRDIVLPPVAPVLAEVNGQQNYWVRARIVSGNYGLPVEFEPVDPAAPEKGFRVKAGTGNVNAPVLTKLTLGYNAERAPTVLTQNGFLHHNRTGQTFAPFISVKQLAPPSHADVEPSFYLGFDAAFPEQPVSLYVAVEPRAFAGSVIKEMGAGAAVSSALPPLRWEYFNGAIWKELAVFDGTNNLTESGAVEFLTPADIAPLAKFDLTPRYWIRARSPENDPFDTQQLAGVFLNTVPAVQAVTVQSETLGSGSGEPNQTLRFARAPVLSGQQLFVRETNPPSDKERAAIEAEEGEDAVQERRNAVTGEPEIRVRWHEVANFLRSDPYSRHYTIDHISGSVTFGDGKRGAPPPRGTNNVAAAYRTGGGAAGNAPKAAIAQVKSPLPGVASVTNPVAADGGADAETLPMAQERGPQTLRHRYRAVACADLEWLARQAAGTRVARAKCLPNVNRDLRFEPGWVTLLIVPQGAEGRLSPGSELIREVEDFLAERAFVGLARQTPARINVIGPGYIQVTVEAEVVPRDIDEAEQVKQRARAALDAFLHPLTGGPEGAGWVFGRDVYESEIYRVIENVPGVSHVKSLRLIPNIVQHRFTFASEPLAPAELPEGSVVMTTDRRKAALLAEPAPAGAAVSRVAIKGFKEGDRITKAQDLTVAALPSSEPSSELDPRGI